ncbi:hypothetical protein [Nocardioides ochotonae]|uniref:hypothetical protein n=1 Tax=Nocardioides ochotonae TaxID=2685869 RepID=UPI00140A1063|nr:hypothetical protein [Nocardioides ochotonae]
MPKPRHLVAVPDNLSAAASNSPIHAALNTLLEEVTALKIYRASLLWNVETDEVFDEHAATANDVATVTAARDRLHERTTRGEPLPANVQRMQAALRRALARDTPDIAERVNAFHPQPRLAPYPDTTTHAKGDSHQ